MYAQAEAPLVATGATTATATWAVANTASLQSDPAYTFLYDLDVGQHAITAVYVGDSNNQGSTSSAVTQVWPPSLPGHDALQCCVAQYEFSA